MPEIVEDVVYQHAENVCSLWMQRQYAVDEPHYSFSDLMHLDSRVEANIDGLRIAGMHALPFIEEMIKANDDGAFFAMALLALEQGNRDVFNDLVDQAEYNAQVLSEVESALAWSRPEYLKEVVQMLLTSDKSAAIILGLSTCESHNKDSGDFLQTHLNSSSSVVRSVALRVCANTGRLDLVVDILNLKEGNSEEEQFEQGRALAFLGEQRSAQKKLYPLAIKQSRYSTPTVNLLTQLSDVKAARSLLKKLDSVGGRERDVVRGVGLIGDPVAMNWLIERAEIPELSRLSGGSITMMTGIDLAEQDLETLDAPEGFEDGGLTDDAADDKVALDEDEDLPWPSPALVRSWWESSAKLPAGRYFLNGREKIYSELRQVLTDGMQRQRNAAAMSIALSKPGMRYLDTRLPTNKQKLWMI